MLDTISIITPSESYIILDYIRVYFPAYMQQEAYKLATYAYNIRPRSLAVFSPTDTLTLISQLRVIIMLV